jgi:hypothetical protein
MRRNGTAALIALSVALAAGITVHDAAARTRNAAAAAAATAPDPDKPDPNSPEAKADKQKRFDDCVAIWDKGTHMTKDQWKRTCKNSLEDLPGL